MVVYEKPYNENGFSMVNLYVYNENAGVDLDMPSFYVDSFFELEQMIRYWKYVFVKFGNYYKCFLLNY